jgi:branched-chain amino acid aminotransferase
VKIYWQGRFVDALRARVPVEGPYLQGSALAEALPVKAGRMCDFKAHASRLAEGARALLLPAPDLDLFRRAGKELIRLNRLKQGSLRCRFFRDGAMLVHPLPLRPLPPGPLRLLCTPVRHYGPDSLQGRLKANSMLPNLLSRWESAAWAEDGLRLTPAGFVAEGVWSNLLVEKKGVLLTPPLAEGILEGVTREAAIRRWKAKGGLVREAPLTRYDLYTADKIWACSSLRGLLRLSEVDGRKIAPL